MSSTQEGAPNADASPPGGEVEARSILVFRIGSLGDTLVSVPSFWAIRQNFPGAKVTLLCDQQVGRRYVLAADVLRGSGTVDDFMLYPVGEDPRFRDGGAWLCCFGEFAGAGSIHSFISPPARVSRRVFAAIGGFFDSLESGG